MSGSGDIKSRESSIITFQIPSDMGFVRKTKKQKIINIRSNSKKGAIPMIPEWLAFWKDFIPSPLSHRCIIKTAPPPSAPTHPQKQPNKQNLSCCLLYCNFYSDLEFSFYRLIHTTDFLWSASQNVLRTQERWLRLLSSKGDLSRSSVTQHDNDGIRFLSAYFITTAVSSSQFKVSSINYLKLVMQWE